MKEIEIYEGFWTVNDIKSNAEKIFIFGDNDLRIGTGGQAVIRNCSNTFGIRTKKKPSNSGDSFYSDDDYDFNTQKILQDILQIKYLQVSGKQLVFSNGGYGTGLASLKSKAPKTFDFLVNCLRNFFQFDNESGKSWKYIPSFDELNFAKYLNISNESVLLPINNSYFRNDCLEKGIFNYFDLIKSENKVAFTSETKYEPGQILNLNVFSNEYLVVKVSQSYNCDFISKEYWSMFEGFNNDFVEDKEIDDLFQTQFEFICTLNPDGTMKFKENIFN